MFFCFTKTDYFKMKSLGSETNEAKIFTNRKEKTEELLATPMKKEDYHRGGWSEPDRYEQDTSDEDTDDNNDDEEATRANQDPQARVLIERLSPLILNKLQNMRVNSSGNSGSQRRLVPEVSIPRLTPVEIDRWMRMDVDEILTVEPENPSRVDQTSAVEGPRSFDSIVKKRPAVDKDQPRTQKIPRLSLGHVSPIEPRQWLDIEVDPSSDNATQSFGSNNMRIVAEPPEPVQEPAIHAEVNPGQLIVAPPNIELIPIENLMSESQAQDYVNSERSLITNDSSEEKLDDNELIERAEWLAEANALSEMNSALKELESAARNAARQALAKVRAEEKAREAIASEAKKRIADERSSVGAVNPPRRIKVRGYSDHDIRADIDSVGVATKSLTSIVVDEFIDFEYGKHTFMPEENSKMTNILNEDYVHVTKNERANFGWFNFTLCGKGRSTVKYLFYANTRIIDLAKIRSSFRHEIVKEAAASVLDPHCRSALTNLRNFSE